MRVLALDGDAAELTRTIDALRELGHEVRSAKSAHEAREKIAASIPEVVLVDINLPLLIGLDFLRHLRSLPAPHYVYIVLLVTSPSDKELQAAYEAGCDAELRKPVKPIQMSTRLTAAGRILQFEAALRKHLSSHGDPKVVVYNMGNVLAAASQGVAPSRSSVQASKVAAPTPAAKAAIPAAAALTPVEIISRSATWRGMAKELQTLASTFLTLGVTLGGAAPEGTVPGLITQIVLSNAEHQLEIRVTLGTDSRAANALTLHMFGEASEELASDLLGELANLAMGSLRAAFSQESITFTGGLPGALAPDRYYQGGVECQLQESFSLLVQGSRIFVRVGLALRKNREITAADLCEGMVLAKDLVTARGELLLTGGTRISSSTAERLRKFLPPKQLIEVAPGAT